MSSKPRAPLRAGEMSQRLEPQDPDYQAILDSASDGIAVLDVDGILKIGNARLYQLLGRSPEDLLGRALTEWFGDAAGEVLQRHVRATRQGDSGFFETDAPSKEGHPSRLLVALKPLRNREGVVEGMVATFTDVTALRRAESLLQDALSQYQQLASTLDVILWEADPHTFLCSYISSEVEQLLGYPPHRWKNETGFWLSIVHPEDRSRVLATCSKASKELTFHTLEYRVIAADSRVVWVRHSGWVVSENGRPTKLRGVMADITERKLSQARGQARASQTELLLACAGEGICAVDSHGTVVFINPAGAALLGYESKNLIGTNFHNSIHYQHTDGSPYPAEKCPVLSVLRGERRVQMVDTYYRADGTPLPVEVVAHALMAESRLEGAVINFRDISDRLRAERERQSKLALLLASSDIFRCLLAESDPVLAGPTVVSILGQAAGVDRCYWFQVDTNAQGQSVVICRAEWCREGVPTHASLPVFQSLPAEALQRLKSALLQGDMFASRWSQLSQEEKHFFGIFGPKSFVVVPLYLEGVISGFLGFDSLDPEHRWSEEEINFLRLGTQAFVLALERHQRARQRAELVAAVEQLSDGLAIFDLQRRALYSNSSMHRFLETPVAHFNDISGVLRVSGGEALQWPQFLDHEDPKNWCRQTLLLQTSTGEKEVEVGLFPIYDAGGKVDRICLTVADISPRLELERKLLRAQKMEALGQFAASIAHDFNNLLMVIGSCLDRAQQRVATGQEAQEELLTIRGTVTRAAELSRRLLAFSRRQALDRKPINLTSLVGGMMPLLRRVLPETITLLFHPEVVDAWTHADAGEMEHVLMNLVANARDAMPQGGFLTISTNRFRLGEDYCLAHPWATPGDYSVFAVSDTGTGMNETTLARLFEPFFSTKEPGRGSGLGLSTVYGIVKQHDGFIDVTSRPGEGSIFTILLPATDPPLETVERPRIPPPRRGNNEHILLVEDHDELRDSLTRNLADLGFRVSQARNGVEALELIKKFRGEIALVISDVVMPGMGGIELYRETRRQYPDIPFLFSTGYAEAGPEEIQWDSSVGFLTKPYSIESLLGKIGELLRQTQPSPALPDPLWGRTQ